MAIELLSRAQDKNEEFVKLMDSFDPNYLENYNQHGIMTPDYKIIDLRHEKTPNTIYRAVLLGQWCSIPLEKGDEVAIIGHFSKSNKAVIIAGLRPPNPAQPNGKASQDDSLLDANLMILEPKILLYPTAITASFPCYRRSLISMLFTKKDDLGSLPALTG